MEAGYELHVVKWLMRPSAGLPASCKWWDRLVSRQHFSGFNGALIYFSYCPVKWHGRLESHQLARRLECLPILYLSSVWCSQMVLPHLLSVISRPFYLLNYTSMKLSRSVNRSFAACQRLQNGRSRRVRTYYPCGLLSLQLSDGQICHDSDKWCVARVSRPVLQGGSLACISEHLQRMKWWTSTVTLRLLRIASAACYLLSPDAHKVEEATGNAPV